MPTNNLARNRVYVLGAGFSRAISGSISDDSKMPTLQELSTAVQDILKQNGSTQIPGADTPIANNFEQWLSYLIEAPPWLSRVDQARNRAASLDVLGAVNAVVQDRQRKTLNPPNAGSCPDWLISLVRLWQQEAATVITFNYDQLVELAWLLHAAPARPRSAPPWGVESSLGAGSWGSGAAACRACPARSSAAGPLLR